MKEVTASGPGTMRPVIPTARYPCVIVLLCAVVAGCRPQAPIAEAAPAAQRAGTPVCSGPQQWPASMTITQLKNAKVLDTTRLDFAKTTVMRIASEQVGTDLFRQVHRITLVEKSGRTIEAIAVSDASSEECSMSGVDVYVIRRHLRPE